MDTLFLSKTMLFRGDTPEEVSAVLNCLKGEVRTYAKGAVILRAGDVTESMGMVLSGSVSVENDDFWGNKSILDRLEPGQVFAETYACVPGEPLMVSVVAAEATEVLFLNAGRVLRICPNTCEHHSRLVRNLLTISARKNLRLSRRMFHTSSKSIRGRLISYLSSERVRQAGSVVVIPFNRQQLADYLNVDRSALSNELSKMQREGLLTVEKNRFVLSVPFLEQMELS